MYADDAYIQFFNGVSKVLKLSAFLFFIKAVEYAISKDLCLNFNIFYSTWSGLLLKLSFEFYVIY
jgi:hypothetical protein